MNFNQWLNESPIIVNKRDEYDTLPYIDVFFPTSKKTWRYFFPNQLIMMQYLDKYRRNVEKLLTKIKDNPQIKQQSINEYATHFINDCPIRKSSIDCYFRSR